MSLCSAQQFRDKKYVVDAIDVEVASGGVSTTDTEDMLHLLSWQEEQRRGREAALGDLLLGAKRISASWAATSHPDRDEDR